MRNKILLLNKFYLIFEIKKLIVTNISNFIPYDDGILNRKIVPSFLNSSPYVKNEYLKTPRKK